MNKKKFNINNYFNGKLFCEAFKQLRIVGIAALICLNALAIFLPVINYLERKDELHYYPGRILFNPESIMMPLIALIFIVTPIMFLILFSFLTKRSGSDFYHSLPIKRSCMFVTFVAAIVSWLFILTSTYALFSVISANISYEHFVIDYSIVINYSINIFVSCILIIGVFALGTAVTGSLTSNIFFSFGILLLPRIIIATLSNLFIINSMVATADSGFAIFNSFINLPFALIASLFTYNPSPVNPLFQLGAPSLYTMILAIIYVFIGMKLFASRPSEVATKSFRSNKIFAIFRITTGFSLSLIMVATIYPALGNEDLFKWISQSKISILCSILAIAISMFALETANTKSIKKGLKTLLFTPVIILVDIAILFGMFSLDKHFKNETINKSNVDYVYVGDFYLTYMLNTDEYSCDYSMYCGEFINQIKITDKEVIDLLVDIYNSYAGKEIRDFRRLYETEITFDSSLGEKSRCIYMTEEQANKLANMLSANEDIQKCFYNFPALDDSAISNYDISPKNNDKLYTSLVEELNGLSYEKLCNEYCNIVDDGNYEFIDTIYVETFVNGSLCSIEFPISSLTPKTYALALECTNKANKTQFEDFVNLIENNTPSEDMFFNFSAYNILPDGISDKYYSFHSEEETIAINDKLDIVLPYLKDAINNEPDFTAESITDKNTLLCFAYFNYYDTCGSYYFTIPADSPFIDGLENLYEDMSIYEGYDKEYIAD